MGSIDRSNLPHYLAGLAAVILSIYFLYRGRTELSIVVASSFFLVICITDTLYQKIYNACTLALLIAGFTLNFWTSGSEGLLFSLYGFLLGLALLLLPYVMGGIGAGDVKALAALGSLLGPGQVFQVFLYTALIGGALGLLHFICSPGFGARCRRGWSVIQSFFLTRDYQAMEGSGKATLKFPYATAIAFGFFSYLQWGKIL